MREDRRALTSYDKRSTISFDELVQIAEFKKKHAGRIEAQRKAYKCKRAQQIGDRFTPGYVGTKPF